jgi:hypothetical protein
MITEFLHTTSRKDLDLFRASLLFFFVRTALISDLCWFISLFLKETSVHQHGANTLTNIAFTLWNVTAHILLCFLVIVVHKILQMIDMRQPFKKTGCTSKYINRDLKHYKKISEIKTTVMYIWKTTEMLWKHEKLRLRKHSHKEHSICGPLVCKLFTLFVPILLVL